MVNKRAGNYEGSEEERLMEAVSRCRTCKHVKMAHSFTLSDKGACLDAAINKQGTYYSCKCKAFIPKENLKYLEWLYNKKNKKGKTNE